LCCYRKQIPVFVNWTAKRMKKLSLPTSSDCQDNESLNVPCNASRRHSWNGISDRLFPPNSCKITNRNEHSDQCQAASLCPEAKINRGPWWNFSLRNVLREKLNEKQFGGQDDVACVKQPSSSTKPSETTQSNAVSLNFAMK